MKLKEFVKMFKNCSLLKEQEESNTVKCFGARNHNVPFEEMMDLIFTYATENDLDPNFNLAANAFDVSQMTGDTCSIELFELIKKVQKDLGFTGSAVDGIAGKNTLAALRGKPISTTQKKPSAKSSLAPTEVIVAGDSIAVGLKGAGAKSVEGATIGGTHTWQILRNLKRNLQSIQEQTSQKTLYVSAGVNDALAYSITSGPDRATRNGLPRGMPNQPFFTPEITSAELDKIATLARSRGYDIKFRLLGPAPFNGNVNTGMGKIDPSRFNEFCQKVNDYLSGKGYSTFATNVAMKSDGIHPTSAGYASLLSSISSGTVSTASSSAPASTVRPIVSTEKDSLIVIGDSNSGAFAKMWYGRGSQQKLQDPDYLAPEHGNRHSTLAWFQHKGKVLAPSIGSGATWDVYKATKRFFELRGENYKPTTALIHMGYNFHGSRQTFPFYKRTIDFLKSKGVSDIRVMELKTNKNPRMDRDAENLSEKLRELAAQSGLTFVNNPGEVDSSGFHFYGSYDKMYNAMISGASTPVDRKTKKAPEKQIKISSTAGSVKVAGSGFPGFISKTSSGSTVKVLSPFGSFNEVMNSVTEIFKAAAKKLNLNVSDDPTVQDLRNLQRKLGISADGSFGPTTMAAISLINSKYANVVSENSANAINLRSNITGSFRGVIEESLTGLLQERTMFGVIDVDDYVENYASASALKKAYQGAINKRLNVSKPPMNNRYAKKDTSWREDKEFLKAIKEYSSRNGVDPKVFLAIMAHETAGTFSPYMVNHIGCTGLIQFCPNSGMKTVGKNQQQLSQMTRAEQWKMVEKFYNKSRSRWANSGSDFATMYLITFSPAFATLPDDAIIYAKDPSRAHPYVRKISSRKTIARAWKQNPANRDPADNTIIRKKSMGAKVKSQITKFNITDELFEV